MVDTSKSTVVGIDRRKELQKVTPVSALSPFDEMERMFENLLQRSWMRPLWKDMEMPLKGKMPSMDVIDQDENVLVRAEVPGVDKKDLDISVTENTLTLKGKTSHEEKEEKGDFYRCEISRGAFSRTVTLPHEVDADKAKAAFKDGMLELTLPKVKRTNRHTIQIE
ncbi:MAG: Hsp20/alpha crystallin family protein [Burkholderiales bacterium]|nr:Hsp20/alpha crystallin family protein [Burkholderiales bacterium]